MRAEAKVRERKIINHLRNAKLICIIKSQAKDLQVRDFSASHWTHCAAKLKSTFACMRQFSTTSEERLLQRSFVSKLSIEMRSHQRHENSWELREKLLHNVNHRLARRDCDCRRLASRVLIFTVKYLKIITHDIGRTIIGSENVECHGKNIQSFSSEKSLHPNASIFSLLLRPVIHSHFRKQTHKIFIFPSSFRLLRSAQHSSIAVGFLCTELWRREEKKKCLFVNPAAAILKVWFSILRWCWCWLRTVKKRWRMERENSQEKKEKATSDAKELQLTLDECTNYYAALTRFSACNNSRKNCAGLAATKQRRRREKRSQMFVVCTST